MRVLLSIAGILLVIVIGLMFVSPVWAQDDVTYEELRDFFSVWTEPEVKEAGFFIVSEGWCVVLAEDKERSLAVAVNEDLFDDDDIVNALQPEIILLDTVECFGCIFRKKNIISCSI